MCIRDRLKTHFPLLVGKQRDPDFFGGSVLRTYFHGVALLARHPVDCVVGELTRWPCQRAADAAKAALDAGAADYGDRLAAVNSERAACRVEAIRGLCRRVKPLGLDKLARQWTDFYEYWLAAADAQDVPVCVEINRRFGTSRPHFEILELGHIEVDVADFWTNRVLSSSPRSTAEKPGPNRSITCTLTSLKI